MLPPAKDIAETQVHHEAPTIEYESSLPKLIQPGGPGFIQTLLHGGDRARGAMPVAKPNDTAGSNIQSATKHSFHHHG
jgi:hypothetical protein